MTTFRKLSVDTCVDFFVEICLSRNVEIFVSKFLSRNFLSKFGVEIFCRNCVQKILKIVKTLKNVYLLIFLEVSHQKPLHRYFYFKLLRLLLFTNSKIFIGNFSVGTRTLFIELNISCVFIIYIRQSNLDHIFTKNI